MRGLLLLVAACGRIGFEARTSGDASSDVAGDAAIAWSHLVAYADQTCALRGGVAYCWGSNSKGQLGDGSIANRGVPTKLALPAGTVNDLAMGETHGAAIVEGVVYGFGDIDGAPAPTAVTTANTGPLPSATAISCGREFTCMTASADVYCWGQNNVGQLANNTTSPQSMPYGVGITKPSGIRAGDDHACALAGGIAVCWGHNDYGTLGNGMTQAMEPYLTAFAAVTGVTTQPLIAGWHACTLSNGQVFCWGEGDHGELGDGGSSNATTAQVVPALANVTALATGGGPTDGDASCAIVAGDVSCWGNGFFGRLGQGSANPSSVPIGVVGLPGPAASLAIGYDHACALLADDTMWCWGRGDSGQLGDGKMTSSLAPVRVATPP